MNNDPPTLQPIAYAPSAEPIPPVVDDIPAPKAKPRREKSKKQTKIKHQEESTPTKITTRERILYAVYGTFAILSLVIATIAAQWMWADIQATGARNLMTHWESQLKITNQDEWTRAFTRMATAYELQPSNADYAADIGRLFEWQALQHPKWSPEAKKYRTEAIKFFHRAVNIRPGWGFMWAHYAQSKVLNQQFDPDTIEALEKAMVLAPWEIKVQQKVIWLGLNLWEKLPSDTKNMLNSEISRALELQPKQTIKLALSINKRKIIEPLLNSEQATMLNTLLNRHSRDLKVSPRESGDGNPGLIKNALNNTNTQ